MERIPPKKGFAKYGGWLITVLIVAFIAAGFLKGGTAGGFGEIVKWVALNGSFAAIGAIVGWANVLAVLAALVFAPVGTLNPFLSVGVFAAIVQALVRPPRVADAETLADALSSARALYTNRITHILLIFFTSSLGGVVGNILTLTPAGGAIIAAVRRVFSF
jgi:pheromone shutdown protein TraB